MRAGSVAAAAKSCCFRTGADATMADDEMVRGPTMQDSRPSISLTVQKHSFSADSIDSQKKAGLSRKTKVGQASMFRLIVLVEQMITKTTR